MEKNKTISNAEASQNPLDKELRRLLQVHCDDEITVRFYYALSEWNGMNEVKVVVFELLKFLRDLQAFQSRRSDLFKIAAPTNRTLPSYCRSQNDNTPNYLHIGFVAGQCAPTIRVNNYTSVYEHHVGGFCLLILSRATISPSTGADLHSKNKHWRSHNTIQRAHEHNSNTLHLQEGEWQGGGECKMPRNISKHIHLALGVRSRRISRQYAPHRRGYAHGDACT